MSPIDLASFDALTDREALTLPANPVPKRSLAIAKELATLATNIPVAFDGSIFLRVDEERVDVIKVRAPHRSSRQSLLA